MRRKIAITTWIILIITVGVIAAFLIGSGQLGGSFEVGEITMDLSPKTSEQVRINLTSPTFLLDPVPVDLYQDDETTSAAYTRHAQQFAESCTKITLTLKNTGNVQGVIGYGTGETSKGIDIALTDPDQDGQNDLAGVVYLILPHNSELTESNYYPYLLGVLEDHSLSLSYTQFSALQTALTSISSETIANAKAEILDPNETIQLDLFIWQEYYDLGPYLSQYDQTGTQDIFKKQEFELLITVYFGQTGIE
ncbi:MAG: hypothetical protein GX661_06415 [Acholeplasmataceae bacterium]|jgi:hypothetical protein|nr:hypothetical protein [Acholeplasmataceae bacterium]